MTLTHLVIIGLIEGACIIIGIYLTARITEWWSKR